MCPDHTYKLIGIEYTISALEKNLYRKALIEVKIGLHAPAYRYRMDASVDLSFSLQQAQHVVKQSAVGFSNFVKLRERF